MDNNQRKFHLICFLILAFLCSCGIRQTTHGTEVPKQIPGASPSPFVSPTKTIRMTETPAYIQKISVSPTPLLVTERPSPTFTWMPRPTLLPDQAQANAKQFYQENGGCQFPCWMGITPGVTRWSEAQAELLPFAKLYWDKKRSYLLYVDVVFPIPRGKDPVTRVGQMTVEHDLITQVNAFFYRDLPLWKLLSNYGKPDEIRIFANGNYAGLGDKGDFNIVLFYPSRGIMAAYNGTANQGKILHVCLDNQHLLSEYRIKLWNPNEPLSFEQAGERLGLPNRDTGSLDQDYIPLSRATNMDTSTFYEIYKLEENQGKCFDVADQSN